MDKAYRTVDIGLNAENIEEVYADALFYVIFKIVFDATNSKLIISNRLFKDRRISKCNGEESGPVCLVRDYISYFLFKGPMGKNMGQFVC